MNIPTGEIEASNIPEGRGETICDFVPTINEVVEQHDENEDIFAGDYEQFVEPVYLPRLDVDFGNPPLEDISSVIKRKRAQLYKVIITRSKKEFESPYTFNDKVPGEEGTVATFEIKSRPPNEYQTIERPYIEMGLQTPNESVEKSYQVQKMRTRNSFSQVERDLADIKEKFEIKTNYYLTNANKLIDIENFLNKTRSLIEQALQSNETIDIFQNDFDLDRTTQIKTEEDTKDKKNELRTFRANIAGQKSKNQKKSVNYIRLVKPDEVFIAHSLLRNMSFDERTKVIGIPSPSQIFFWNFNNREINAPVFILDVPMEVTAFEFCPTNLDKMVCALYSGQIIIFDIKDLLGILKRASDSEVITNKKQNKRDLYEFFITPVGDSHKTHITSMKWFPKNLHFHKSHLTSNESNECTLLATLGEDGQVLIWDLKYYEMNSSRGDSTPYNLRPTLRVEINKMDSLSKLCGTGLEMKINIKNPMLYVSTDEGQIYTIDWTVRITQENLTANVKKVYSTRYYRPVITFEASPFYSYIFLTLHDYHFCLWAENRAKPILTSPNLKKSFYTHAKFSPTRPSVIYLSRNNGFIDIWDFLDESHKPSVKEYFIKESILFLEIFKHYPNIEDEDRKTQTKYVEFLAIGDSAGQLTLMEISKLFSEPALDEERLMEEILQNEIKRQEYMEFRYIYIDEDSTKPDSLDDITEEKVEKTHEKEDVEVKYIEDNFVNEKMKILEELGLIFTNNVEHEKK